MQYLQGRRPPGRAPWILAVAMLAASLPAQAGTSPLAVSAVVLSRSLCFFQTGPRTLDFGTIQPTSMVPATATNTIQFWCIGGSGSTTYSIQAGNGLHSPGAGLRRVRHASVLTEYMAYTLTLTPASATIPWLASQTITVNGSIDPSQFQNARFGGYSDTVVIDLDP